MSNHTPGPWTHSDQVGGTGHCFCAQVWDANERSLAVLESTANPAEATSNARLIAAAPDLLEALRKFVAWHDMDHETMTGGEVQAVYDQAIDAAKSVLHKATGANQ